MAATYTVIGANLTPAANKNMLAIANATGSGKVIRIYRAWILNECVGATATVGLMNYTIGRWTGALAGGTAVPFCTHATPATAGANTPFTGIAAVSGATAITAPAVGAATEIHRISRSTGRVITAVGTLAEAGSIPIWNMIWDSGYADTNIVPLVINPNEVVIIASGALNPSGATMVAGTTIQVELTIT